jgi:hypothetical protein
MGRPSSGSVRTLAALYDRAPKKYEVVHHKNGDPSDNRPENLEILTRSKHAWKHARKRFHARYPRARDLALIHGKEPGMATTERGPVVPAGPTAPTAHKLPEDFEANEPTGGGTGVDKDGKPDQTLSPKQLARAANEALLSLRPQPSATEIEAVLEALAETDEKGHPKIKVKTAKEAADKAVAELSKK